MHQSKKIEQKVEPRSLPYPFNKFITIASDCDAPSYEKFINIARVFRHDFGLPIADSIFPSWLYRRGFKSYFSKSTSGKTPCFDSSLFEDNNVEILNLSYRGWYDTIHGWIQRFMIKISDDFTLCIGIGQKYIKFLPKKIISKSIGLKSSKRIFFRAPEGWQQMEAPRFLSMKYQMPVESSYFLIEGFSKNEKIFTIHSSNIKQGHRLVPLPYTVDLFQYTQDADILHNLYLKISLYGPIGSVLKVEKPTLYSETKETVSHMADVLKGYNINLKVYTSHGIGAVVGAQYASSISSSDTRFCSDYPSNANYFMDIFKDYGLKWFNTFNNVSQTNILKLTDVTRPFLFNDGKLAYDFNKFAYIKQNEDGTYNYSDFNHNGSTLNYSLSNFINIHIQGLLNNAQSGMGGVIYTHAGCYEPILLKNKPQLHRDLINIETKESLYLLANSYYNLSGDIPNKDRTWVAPTSAILNLSLLNKSLQKCLWYDNESHILNINSYTDLILNQTIPSSSISLANFTVYVPSSQKCRVFLDGNKEIKHLIRNPKDETGKESITIADIDSPYVLFDDIHPSNRCKDINMDGVEFHLTSSTSYQSKLSYQFTILKDKATATFTFKVPVSLKDVFFLRFAHLTKDDTDFDLILNFTNGSSIGLRDTYQLDFDIFANKGTSDWKEVIIPFYFFSSLISNKINAIPSDFELESLQMLISGEPGENVFIDKIQFLNHTTMNPGYCYMLSGQVMPTNLSRKLKFIVIKQGEQEFNTDIKKNGFFIIKIPKIEGDVVSVFAVDDKENIHYPINYGENIEVWSNIYDIYF